MTIFFWTKWIENFKWEKQWTETAPAIGLTTLDKNQFHTNGFLYSDNVLTHMYTYTK